MLTPHLPEGRSCFLSRGVEDSRALLPWVLCSPFPVSDSLVPRERWRAGAVLWSQLAEPWPLAVFPPYEP